MQRMEKMKKDLSKPEISEFCGDGSCGCGCDESVGNNNILTKEELQKSRSFSNGKSPAPSGPKGRRIKLSREQSRPWL